MAGGDANGYDGATETTTPTNLHLLNRLWHNILIRTAIYYVVVFGIAALLWDLPQFKAVIHESLDALASGNGFAGLGKASSLQGVGTVPVSQTTLALTVAISMIGSCLLALPVAWIYTLTRKKRGFSQSVVQTLILLPAVVAGVVVLVKYSLALAFGLTGIVAAVRFRTSLDDSKDAVYVFVATAVGLAAGVQLPMAAVLSVMFNVVVLALWYTDFGKAGAALEGARAERRLEETRARLRKTGSFVAQVDDELLADMTPEQLDLVADRAWRRKRRLETDDVPEEDMQKREALLRIRVLDVHAEETRRAAELAFDDFLKKWRFGGVVHEPDAVQVVEYVVQLKKSARSADLIDALNTESRVIDVEMK